LNAEEDFVRVRVKLNWNEKHKMLKLAFPIACKDPTSIYEIPFGSFERPCNGEEEPALMWAMVGDLRGGLAILNDSKYSYSAKDNVLSLTAIRSPIYCDHGRVRSEESNYTDQGVHEFAYAILPANTGERVRIFRKALQFNTPLTSVLENHHEGGLPLVLQGIDVGADNIVVSAVKRSEDGTGYVVRAYECEGIETETMIELSGLPELCASFGAYEVKTYFLKDGEWTEVLFTEYKE
jgi:alpha-mannosidase